MRNAMIGGLLGVLAGAAVLAACGGAGVVTSANATVDELEARVIQLEADLAQAVARADAHEMDPDAHMPRRGKLAVNYCIALTGTFPQRNKRDLDEGSTESVLDTAHIGAIGLFAGTFAPRGWALCDGQELLINDHQVLFSILGTTYGGDGRTTFRVPDLRGRAPIHVGPSDRLGDAAD